MCFPFFFSLVFDPLQEQVKNVLTRSITWPAQLAQQFFNSLSLLLSYKARSWKHFLDLELMYIVRSTCDKIHGETVFCKVMFYTFYSYRLVTWTLPQRKIYHPTLVVTLHDGNPGNLTWHSLAWHWLDDTDWRKEKGWCQNGINWF